MDNSTGQSIFPEDDPQSSLSRLARTRKTPQSTEDEYDFQEAVLDAVMDDLEEALKRDAKQQNT